MTELPVPKVIVKSVLPVLPHNFTDQNPFKINFNQQSIIGAYGRL